MSMSMSTTAYLQFVNQVLYDCAESALDDINDTSPIAAKFKHFTRTAFQDVVTAIDWPWLRTRTNNVAWNGSVATIPDMQRLLSVSQFDRHIPFVRNDMWIRYPLAAMTSDNAYIMMARQLSDNTYEFNNYPDTIARRQSIYFEYIRIPAFPTLGDGKFDMPERFVKLMYHKAVYYAMLRHVHDIDQAAYAQGEYEQYLNLLQARERNPVGVNRFNIFTGR